MIVLALAQQLGENPLAVAQNVFLVKGRAGWSAQYMIARTNRAGVFKGRIGWRVVTRPKPLAFKRREKDGQGWVTTDATMADLSVTAYAVLADTGEEVSFTVDSSMAIADGWADNKKYTSLTELMLRYRSAAFLVRLNCPDVMLGYQTAEELETIQAGDVTAHAEQRAAPERGTAGIMAALTVAAPAPSMPTPVPEREPVPVVAEAPTKVQAAPPSPMWARISEMEQLIDADPRASGKVAALRTECGLDGAECSDDRARAYQARLSGVIDGLL
jgi:hypothetical protein